MRQITVKYEGECSKCGAVLPVSSQAMYEKTTGIFCVGCEPTTTDEIRKYRQIKLDRKSESRQDWANSARKKADAIDESLTPYKDFAFITQPILIGHHSENSHRNLLKRIHNKMDKEHELRQKAERHQSLVGRKAVVKGDAERNRQRQRENQDKIIGKGTKIFDFCFGNGTVVKVNKKTYTIQFESGSKFTRDKVYVKIKSELGIAMDKLNKERDNE